MKALGIALVVIGYALFYSGASNLFTGGQGWGFLQALLNKGTANQSGSVPNTLGGGKDDGKSGESKGGLSGLLNGLTNPLGGIL